MPGLDAKVECLPLSGGAAAHDVTGAAALDSVRCARQRRAASAYQLDFRATPGISRPAGAENGMRASREQRSRPQ